MAIDHKTLTEKARMLQESASFFGGRATARYSCGRESSTGLLNPLARNNPFHFTLTL